MPAEWLQGCMHRAQAPSDEPERTFLLEQTSQTWCETQPGATYQLVAWDFGCLCGSREEPLSRSAPKHACFRAGRHFRNLLRGAAPQLSLAWLCFEVLLPPPSHPPWTGMTHLSLSLSLSLRQHQCRRGCAPSLHRAIYPRGTSYTSDPGHGLAYSPRCSFHSDHAFCPLARTCLHLHLHLHPHLHQPV